MQEQARVGLARGIADAVVQKNGDLVRLAPGAPGKIAEVGAGRLVLDGDLIVPAEGDAVVMRRRLSRDGLVVVVVHPSGNAQIESMGLPLDEDHADFIAEARADIAKALRNLKGAARRDAGEISEAARLAARRAASRWSGKRPQVRVILAES